MNNIKDFDQYLKEKYFKLSKKDKEYLLVAFCVFRGNYGKKMLFYRA